MYSVQFYKSHINNTHLKISCQQHSPTNNMSPTLTYKSPINNTLLQITSQQHSPTNHISITLTYKSHISNTHLQVTCQQHSPTNLMSTTLSYKSHVTNTNLESVELRRWRASLAQKKTHETSSCSHPVWKKSRRLKTILRPL